MRAKNYHVAEFLDAVQRRFDTDAPDSFWDCEGPFALLAKSDVGREVMNGDIERMCQDTTFNGLGGAGELILHQGGGTALIITLTESPLRYLHVLPYHAMYAVLGSEGISFQRFAVPQTYKNEVFDPNLRLAAPESGFLTPGATLRIPCGEFALDLQIQHPVLMLKFVTSALLPLEWLFRRDTHQAWQANDADLSFTQLRVAADVLGKIAHQSSIQPLKLMSKHGHHAVRWSAITNLGRINRSEAILKLKDALSDPHPHVRNAAAKTLQKLAPR